MRSFFYLVLVLLAGGAMIVFATTPAGCQRLATDAGNDALAVGKGIGSIRENGVNHWDRAAAPLKKMAKDVASDFSNIDGTSVSVESRAAADQGGANTESDAESATSAPASTNAAISVAAPPPPAVDPVIDEFNSTLATARLTRKKVLLLFTGSTWCPTCIAFERYVVPSAKFRYFVGNSYVMMKIEMKQKGLTTDPSEILSAKFNAQGLPALIAVTPDGVEIGRFQGSPTEFDNSPGSFKSVDRFLDDVIAGLTHTAVPTPEQSPDMPRAL